MLYRSRLKAASEQHLSILCEPEQSRSIHAGPGLILLLEAKKLVLNQNHRSRWQLDLKSRQITPVGICLEVPQVRTGVVGDPSEAQRDDLFGHGGWLVCAIW